MNFTDRGGEVEVSGVGDFDLAKIFGCGQCFRWDKGSDGAFTGVVLGRVARVRQCGDSVFISGSLSDFVSVWRGYFDLDRDYEEIRRRLCVDDFMRMVTAFGAGIRILRQDSWEALCSFILSQRNNIPRIRQIVSALCREFGDRLVFDGGEFFSFPSADRLAGLEACDLDPVRCGYRAEYVIGAARAVASGMVDLDALALGTVGDARASLLGLHGVGTKVADCAVLFGLHLLDAFPVDVWVKRAVDEFYGPGFDPGIFSPYAGVAQQYIFHWQTRQGSRRTGTT